VGAEKQCVMRKGSRLIEWAATLPGLLFPRVCPACSKSLFWHEEMICTPCTLHLPETGYWNFPDNKVAVIFWGRVPLIHCSSFLIYRKGNSVQKLIHQLKYKGRQDIGEYLGSRFGKKLKAIEALKDVDAVVPVPLHRKKEHKRGYNQSLPIAYGIAAELGKPVDNQIVGRKVHNQSQTTKDRFGRWENAKERFALVKGANPQGKHLLIVDDVITTGSTLEALAMAFKDVPGIRLSVVSLGCAS
jgi:ComF family protein